MFRISQAKLGKLFNIITKPYLLSFLFGYKVAGGVEHKRILEACKYKLIVDVGANKGQFAIASRYYSPSARVISFEPLPSAFKVLKKIFLSDPMVLSYCCGIGNKNSTTTIYISNSDDSSSLLPMGKKQESIFPGTYQVGTLEIEVKKLTEFIAVNEIPENSLLKIDVQGYEYEVLEGALPLLSSFKFIYCECSYTELYAGQKLAEDVIKLLEYSNFELVDRYNLYLDNGKAPIQADFLFRNKIS